VSEPPKTIGPDLRTLYATFPGAGEPPVCDEVPAAAVPPPYHRLLVHEHHMTVTVEAHHGRPVYLRVLRRHRAGPWYARMILLLPVGTDRVVQFGIMRINLDLCGTQVRREIVAENTPLGRILIKHNVLRRIEPTAFLRVTPNADLMTWFDLAEPRTTYGRLAIIHCDDKPAVELLEIVAPEPPDPAADPPAAS
jgi:chorismate-pyruvate lyase